MSTAPTARGVEPGTLLFGKTRRLLLAWLCGHPDERFYLRQLVRQTGAAQGAVQRELLALSRAALVKRTVEGRQVYFQANRDSPIFPELEQLLLKTAGATEVIRQALVPLSGSIQLAFIFGSAANATMRPASDIDLLIVGSLSFGDVVAALGQAQQRLGRDISPNVYPADEFVQKVRSGHHFLTTVLHEPKTFIIGSDDELSRLAETRVADRTPTKRSRDRRSARGR